MSKELAKNKDKNTWEHYVNEVMPQFNQIAEREKLVIWKAAILSCCRVWMRP